MSKARIFISYSHRANGPRWKAVLLRALHVFEGHHLLDVWEDGKIRVSSFWDDDILQAMTSAKLAVILLTDESLKSEYILTKELPCLCERQQREKLPVFPVICEPCDWKAHDWLRATQAPNESNPLSGLSDDQIERVFRQLATAIAENLSQIALVSITDPDAAPEPPRLYLDEFPLTRGSGQREEKLIGREQELALLDLAYAQPHTAIVSLVAWGGVGKTMLVQHWLQRLQRDGWFGSRRVYAWSFYSQGTKEDRQASEDTFLAHALEWFGVQCEPTLSPWDKGRLLAAAIVRERTLLILDGIEPLQYPPGPMGGQLRAPGVQSLLKQLARRANSGARSQVSETDNCLCLVTTREPLTDLADFQRREGSQWGSVLRVDLGNLTNEAGAALLHHAGANRAGVAGIKPDDKELLAASREVDGHALTLNLLGRFLARAHGGDIRRRDLVKFEEADRDERGGTTFRMLVAFENWLAKSGEFGARQLAILRMLGLFDRPADEGCLGVLREPPAIAGLTDPLFTIRLDVNTGQSSLQPILDEDWNTATSFLADFGLIVSQADDDREKCSLDCHPLIREHFAKRLSESVSESWRSSHRRLYEHLCATAPSSTNYDELRFATERLGLRAKGPQPTLGDLQPLYQAIAHGCKASSYQDAWDNSFWARILRGPAKYSANQLGAFSSNLGAVALFFVQPWSCPFPALSPDHHGQCFDEAAFALQALGRINEACEPRRMSNALSLGKGDWRNAARSTSMLSELKLTLGDIAGAARAGEESVSYADCCGDEGDTIVLRRVDEQGKMVTRCAHADALYQGGFRADAETLFRWAESMQENLDPDHQLLYGRSGFAYCDLLLAASERVAWQKVVASLSSLNQTRDGTRPSSTEGASAGLKPETALAACRAVSQRAAQTLKIAKENGLGPLAISLDHLTLGRAALYAATQENSDLRLLISDSSDIAAAVPGLRHAGTMHHLPRGLLTRSWLRFLAGDADGSQADLDEAWDIAERGPMRLHMADIHLHRARLFFREKPYPWKSPQDDLAAAEKLINDCGYHRRDEELADAKCAILGR